MRKLFLLVPVALSVLSCSEYQKALKNEDVKAKYEMAETLYKDGDYKKANRLFEQIAPKYIGKPQGERVMFFFADSYYKSKDYYLAAYQFERFTKSYAKSDKIQQASFLGAKSSYMLSPRYSLDQTDTDKALSKLQTFINTYPTSEYFAEANIIAKELTTKKEKKALEIAKQFDKIGAWDFQRLISAIAAFDNFLSDFPGSVYREDALFYRFNASTNLALNSTLDKKKERLQSARSAYDNLYKYYPQTQFDKKAEILNKKIEKELQGYSK